MYLATGGEGFIGFHPSLYLLKKKIKFTPKIKINEGIKIFLDSYFQCYKVKI